MGSGAEHLDLLRERLRSETMALEGFRSDGGRALGSLCFAFPPAIGAGLGMRPVRVLAGATQEMESLGERFVRPDVCPLAKSALGAVSSRAGLHGMIDAWVGMYTCDQTRRLFQELSRLTGAVVHHLQLPATRTPEAREFFVSQIERLVSDLSATVAGRPYDRDSAAGWETGRQVSAALLTSLASSCSVPPVALHLMYRLLDFARPEGLSAAFSEAASLVTDWRPRFPVAVTGSPLLLEEDYIPRFLERRGIAMIPLGCSGGQNAIPDGRHCSGDPACLAGVWFDSLRCTRCRPNEATFEHLESEIARTGCRGLIVKSLKFCDLWFTEKERIRARMPVPVLVLDTSFTVGETERLRTRVEAFMESIS
ncbi:2-hydroxyacyl-CoA dehydratase [Candidatus Fermentibacteria bacterium]|nr:2-hydroxyacyl-CoA dehydratase [Candidatus Fermentibacteria bacterium]